ncbi:MAG TPA: glutamyl-tRNA reductase [Vicinamibacteria bacterium]|nr:glutamyl-tRNA reductase [Vicinamibacteria bacterium]
MILVVGLNHETAPVAVREALAFPKERLAEALARVREDAGLGEAMILSTCNRVEVYGRSGEGAGGAVAAFLARYHGRDPAELEPHLYRLEGEAAVRHAFRVAASLDSMVMGEPQILGQVKDAYEAAEKAGSLGAVLNALRNRSVAAAKRARTETAIGRNAVSVSHVAVELARKIFGELRERAVLLVGAGKMSEVAARQMVRDGARATVLGGRTFEKAEQLAAALGGRAAPFEALRTELARTDIVISGTGAAGVVIQRPDVEAAQAARRGRPLFLIDIAVPRDIAADAGKVAGVFLYDLDDVKTVAEANLRERKKEAAAAEAILDQEIREFVEWRRSLEVVPLLVELRRRADEIRKAELEKARKRLGPLTPEQESALEAATSAIVNKLLHGPTVQLKELAGNGQAEHVGFIRKLFGL